MKRLIILLPLLLGGCSTWNEMDKVEKQAWIFSAAIVGAAALLSEQGDTITVKQDNCFESRCERNPDIL